MTDRDHNAFLAMYGHMECENPFDEWFAWDPDDDDGFALEPDDWEDEEDSRYWWI